MPLLIDDNFGVYEVGPGDDPEEVREFYDQNQRRSVRKKCKGCGRMVKILPEYAYCNSCTEKIERGEDVG